MAENQYLSFYIYYAEPWEGLLIEAIYPLMKQLVEDALISQYFFIRYWERGPHIRLRLKKKRAIKDEAVSLIVQEKLNNFILKYPSELFLTPEMEQRRVAESWHENNQILSVKYQPELSRYGGVDAMPLAELQFFASSEIVIHEFLENPNWSYDHALGAAIKLHLGFVYAMGMTENEAVKFFEKNGRDWLPRASPDKDSEAKTNKILAQFQAAYVAQKTTVLPYIQNIWKELQKHSARNDSSSWGNWLNVNHAILTNLQLLQKNGILKTEHSESKIWDMLSDFIHLTNNRLGVMNRDEGFLAFMLAKSLKEKESPLNDI